MDRKKDEKSLKGSLFQRGKNGLWYYRVTIATGITKQFPMKTADYEKALSLAQYYDSVFECNRIKDITAKLCEYKGLLKRESGLSLTDLWSTYEASPDRDHAEKHTHDGYRATLTEFVEFAKKDCVTLDDITFETAQKFSNYLKTTGLSVYTHNRKIKRLRKIFHCFQNFYLGDNPFQSSGLLRKEREERDHAEPRRAFTREQLQQIRDVLDDPAFRMKNKAEIKVIYYLGMCTGLRLKDCVLLKWSEVDMGKRQIFLLQHKTNRPVQIPIANILHQVLQEAMTWKRNSYVCPCCTERYLREDRHGKNIGSNLLDHDVLQVIRAIGLEPSAEVKGRRKKTNVYGFHSLRHTFCSLASESPDVTREAIRAVIGDSKNMIDRYYTHTSVAAQRTAIDAVIGSESSSAEHRILQALSLLDSLPNHPNVERLKALLMTAPSAKQSLRFPVYGKNLSLVK